MHFSTPNPWNHEEKRIYSESSGGKDSFDVNFMAKVLTNQKLVLLCKIKVNFK